MFIEAIVSNCLTRMFSITFFLTLSQFDAKLARVQTKPKSYPESTVLPQSIYRRVSFSSLAVKKINTLMCFRKSCLTFTNNTLNHFS